MPVPEATLRGLAVHGAVPVQVATGMVAPIPRSATNRPKATPLPVPLAEKRLGATAATVTEPFWLALVWDEAGGVATQFGAVEEKTAKVAGPVATVCGICASICVGDT